MKREEKAKRPGEYVKEKEGGNFKMIENKEKEQGIPAYEGVVKEEQVRCEGATGEEAMEAGLVGEMNPYTRKEYETNSVRIHPKRIGYVQVYDRGEHKWRDMTEWAFLGYQERKKALLGKAYKPPIYLD